MSPILVDKLMEVLNGWVGKDYNPGISSQCAVFTRHAWKEAGMDLPVVSCPDDGILETGPGFANSFAGNEIGPKVEIRDIRPGDVIMFKNTYGDYPPGTITHVATCVGSNMMVDRPTMSKPVQKRSIFSFGQKGIAQIRRPVALHENMVASVDPIRVVLVEGNSFNAIPCNPQLADDKVRVDLKAVCNFLGFEVQYEKENNVVSVRRK